MTRRLVFRTRCEVVLDIVFDGSGVWRELGHLGHSFEGLLDSIARRCRARLHVPISRRASLPEVKPVGYLSDSQSAVHVLFVGEQDEGSPTQLLAPQRVLQLPVRLVQTLLVRAVHHEHDGRHIVVEALPVLPHPALAADVPDGQRDVFRFLFDVQHLHVEADGGRGGDEGVMLQLVEEGRFSRVVQAQEENLGLRLFGASLSHGDASTVRVGSTRCPSATTCTCCCLIDEPLSPHWITPHLRSKFVPQSVPLFFLQSPSLILHCCSSGQQDRREWTLHLKRYQFDLFSQVIYHLESITAHWVVWDSLQIKHGYSSENTNILGRVFPPKFHLLKCSPLLSRRWKILRNVKHHNPI